MDSHGIVQPHRLERGACALATACRKNNECDGTQQHQSIRVRYRMHAWVQKDVAGALETTCTRSHKCGMGAWDGDKSQCQCKQL